MEYSLKNLVKNMKVIFKKTKNTVKEKQNIQMEAFMKEIIEIIKDMVREYF